ncbi:unnamed protein product [Discosporangium mesarthrocarpum]
MGKVAEWIEEACNCSEVSEGVCCQAFCVQGFEMLTWKMTHPVNMYMLRRTLGQVAEPTAMCLATVGQDGRPSARFVLAKGVDEEGVTWYTNYNSRKGRDLENYPFAALTFWWGPMRRSVRLEGEVSRVSAKESDEYFSSRPLGSRIGAWVSDQSKPVASREELDKRQKFVQERLSPLGNEVPRPPHWGGFLLTPTRVEFWSGQPSRLHDRIVYTLVSTDTSTSNGTAKKRVEVDDPDEGSLENKREAQWEITRLQP